MPNQHYAYFFAPNAHKNAFNVLMTRTVFTLDDPTNSNSCGIPLNPSGDWLQPITHWYGGAWIPTEEIFAMLNNLPDHVPVDGWPVTGVTGPVSLSEAEAAASVGLIFSVSKEEVTEEDINPLRDAVFAALGLAIAEEPPP